MKISGSYYVYPIGNGPTSFSMDATVQSQDDCEHLIRFIGRIKDIYKDIDKQRVTHGDNT